MTLKNEGIYLGSPSKFFLRSTILKSLTEWTTISTKPDDQYICAHLNYQNYKDV